MNASPLPPPDPARRAPDPTTMSIGPNEPQGWTARKWSARAVGAVVYLVPFIASIAAAFALSSALPAAANLFVGVFRWLAIAVVSTIVLVIVERQTRRLMPLRTLLGLTLAFPDKAPSRFKIAIRTGTTNQLRERLDEARTGGLGDTPSEAAERLLELVGMLSHHDRLTRGHSERVRAYSQMIGAEMGLSPRELDRLRWAGLLHDVGKLAIDPAILNKPGKLSNEEFELIKSHPMEGKALVEPLADWLGESARAVWEHHERYDGGGYPQGLAGTEISQAARIVSVADVFDVITSVRSYKTATSAREAREELARCAGSQFDPDVVRAFLALSMGGVRKTMGPLSWVAQLALLPSAVAAQAGSTLATAAVVTAGATAGTMGMVVDPEPAMVEQPTQFVATVDEVANESDRVAAAGGSTGGARAGTSDAGAASSPGSPASDVAGANADGTPDPLAPVDTPISVPVDVDGAGDSVGPNTTDADGATTSTTIAVAGGVASSTSIAARQPQDATTTTSTTTSTVPERSGSATTSTSTTTTSTSTTTTSIAPTTTSTPTTTTTTTTTVPALVGDVDDDLYLRVVNTSDQASSAILPLSTDEGPDVGLSNYDTNRDDAPGLLIEKDSAGINGTDSTKVQRWRTEFTERWEIDDDVIVRLDVAAKDFEQKDIRVQVQLLSCNGQICQSLGVGDKVVYNADRFRNVNIGLGEIDTTLTPGETLELKVAILGDSEDDAWLAFGTKDHAARILLDD